MRQGGGAFLDDFLEKIHRGCTPRATEAAYLRQIGSDKRPCARSVAYQGFMQHGQDSGSKTAHSAQTHQNGVIICSVRDQTCMPSRDATDLGPQHPCGRDEMPRACPDPPDLHFPKNLWLTTNSRGAAAKVARVISHPTPVGRGIPCLCGIWKVSLVSNHRTTL